MSLYEEIKKCFKIENAYFRWENYRNTLTDYLIEVVDNQEIQIDRITEIDFSAELPTIAIVGAGACNDIDLKRLLPCFSKISLIDTDEEALDEGLFREGLMNHDKINKKIYSLNGVVQQDYEIFILDLQKFVESDSYHITPESFCEYAMDCVENIVGRTRKADIEGFGQYDYVWCFGVHSQLQSMFGYIYKSFLVQLENKLFPEASMVEEPFYRLLKKMNEKQIPDMNDLLLQGAKVCTILGNEWDMIQDTDAVYKWSESPNHAIEGAYQGILDIKRRDMECGEKMLLWPFCQEQNQNFMVLIQEIKK